MNIIALLSPIHFSFIFSFFELSVINLKPLHAYYQLLRIVRTDWGLKGVLFVMKMIYNQIVE